jgi:hypothetical protein
VYPDVQAKYAPPSTLHSNVAAASGELKVNVPVAALDGFGGVLVIVVSGAAVSTTHA